MSSMTWVLQPGWKLLMINIIKIYGVIKSTFSCSYLHLNGSVSNYVFILVILYFEGLAQVFKSKVITLENIFSVQILEGEWNKNNTKQYIFLH